jgi:hypothetical protein
MRLRPLLPLTPLLLSACTDGDRAFENGECPSGETCSDKTPRGLQFHGTSTFDGLFDFGPNVTAIGGTQEVTIMIERGVTEVPLDIAFRAESGTHVPVAATTGAVVTLHGDATGTDKLRIVDPVTAELFDRTSVAAAAIDSLGFGLAGLFGNPGKSTDIVFAPGDHRFAVALRAAPGSDGFRGRLVDRSMKLALAGATQLAWDTLDVKDAKPGTQTIAITAGGADRTLLFEVVAGADAISVDLMTPLTVGQEAIVCLQALNRGRFVADLANWTFASDNGAISNALPSSRCFDLKPAAAGTAHVHATAGGASADLALPVAAAARLAAPPPAAPPLRPAAGDRAQMLAD